MYQRALRSIILQVTQSCNFRCTYCPYTNNTGDERTHSSKRMSLSTAQKAIADDIDYYKQQKNSGQNKMDASRKIQRSIHDEKLIIQFK